MNTPPAPPGSWTVDPSQSSVTWSVKHLGVSVVHGAFGEFDGRLADGRAGGTVAAASVRSDDEKRNDFVRSADFLAADDFPELRFTGELEDATAGPLTGELTIRDTTLPLTLAVERSDPGGGAIGLRLTGTVLRRDYGLRFPQAFGAADRSVANEVEVEADLVLVPAA